MSELFIELLSEEIPYWLQKNIAEQFTNGAVLKLKNQNYITSPEFPRHFCDKISPECPRYNQSRPIP